MGPATLIALGILVVVASIVLNDISRMRAAAAKPRTRPEDIDLVPRNVNDPLALDLESRVGTAVRDVRQSVTRPAAAVAHSEDAYRASSDADVVLGRAGQTIGDAIGAFTSGAVLGELTSMATRAPGVVGSSGLTGAGETVHNIWSTPAFQEIVAWADAVKFPTWDFPIPGGRVGR